LDSADDLRLDVNLLIILRFLLLRNILSKSPNPGSPKVQQSVCAIRVTDTNTRVAANNVRIERRLTRAVRRAKRVP